MTVGRVFILSCRPHYKAVAALEAVYFNKLKNVLRAKAKLQRASDGKVPIRMLIKILQLVAALIALSYSLLLPHHC